MNKLPVYYPGSSIVALFRVRDRKTKAPVPLGDYRVEALFYTRLLGRKVHASEIDPGKIPITAVNHYVLKTEIPPAESAKLPCGTCSVKLTLRHKTDNSVLIVSRKLFTLQETAKP